MASEQKPTYEVIKLLGEGGFGKVFLLQDANNPNIRFAMKLMNLLQMGTDGVDLMVQEINLLATLNHKHVLKYITCFRQNFQVCIITEFCPNGDLGDYIEFRRGTKLEEDRLIEWFRQIASAVEYLHLNNVIHRDLKLKNVFLNEEMDCILGDLGVARKVDSGADYAQTVVGTVSYMSPEIFLGLPYNSKTDIWSLGVLMYELAALEKPFNSFFLPLLIHQVTMGETPTLPGGYCTDLSDLLSTMLEKLPTGRPSASQIMKHKLFQRKTMPKPLERFKTGIIKKETIKDKNIGSYVNAFIKMKQLAKIAKMRVQKRNLDKIQESAEADPNLQPAGNDWQTSTSGARNFGAVSDSEPQVHTKTMTLKEMHDLDKTTTLANCGKTTYMKDQFEQFKLYCLKVVENDEVLFKEASLALNKSGGNADVEGKLLKVLGKEKFEKCGVQMLYYKNYGHNLKNK